MTHSDDQGPIDETPGLQWMEDSIEHLIQTGITLLLTLVRALRALLIAVWEHIPKRKA